MVGWFPMYSKGERKGRLVPLYPKGEGKGRLVSLYEGRGKAIGWLPCIRGN